MGGVSSVESDNFFKAWGFIPGKLNLGDPSANPLAWVTIFTAMFMHGGFMHFAGNMMFLWVFGDNIEDRIGHVKYLFFYLFAGVVATLARFAIDPSSSTPLVGVSGAISGVLGAYVVLYIIRVIEFMAAILLGLWFVWQLFQGLISLGLSSQVDVGFFAHIGGFVAGSLILVAIKLAACEPLKPVNPRRPYLD